MHTNWEYEKVFEKFKDCLPPEFKDKPNGMPVPVTMFQGVPCSIYGAPLEKDADSISFTYKEMEFPRFSAFDQRKYREKNGFIQVVYPGDAVRRGRFLVVHHTAQGERNPIIEVSDGGRAVFRARQWCRVLACDFDKTRDERIVVSEEEYRNLLLRLSENMVEPTKYWKKFERGGFAVEKYWELEEPVIKKSEKNVVKIYRKQGRIQVFPRVNSSRHGIGRGATLNLESFHIVDLLELKSLIVETIDNQMMGFEQDTC